MKILQVIPKNIRTVIASSGIDLLAELSRFPLKKLTSLRYRLSHETEYEAETTDTTQLSNLEDSAKHISFTFAAISLSAAVARADGTVTREEYLAFRDCFPLSGGMCGKLRQLFLLACRNNSPISEYTVLIKKLFPKQQELLISLVDRLFRIAVADLPLSKAESRIIGKISYSLGISPEHYSALHDKYSRPLPPHLVLGVKKRSPQNIIKQHYYNLMKRYHPDLFPPLTTSPEVKMLLTLRSSEISQAYNALSKRAA